MENSEVDFLEVLIRRNERKLALMLCLNNPNKVHEYFEAGVLDKADFCSILRHHYLSDSGDVPRKLEEGLRKHLISWNEFVQNSRAYYMRFSQSSNIPIQGYLDGFLNWDEYFLYIYSECDRYTDEDYFQCITIPSLIKAEENREEIKFNRNECERHYGSLKKSQLDRKIEKLFDGKVISAI